MSTNDTIEVRVGEQLDKEKLLAWWNKNLGPCSDVDLKQFPSGHSNLTYCLTVDGKEVVLRRPPNGSDVKSAHDMGREVRVLKKLQGVFSKVPKILAFEEDKTVLGTPFYVMERLRGRIIRKELSASFSKEEDALQTLNRALIDVLVDLHDVDTEALGITWGQPDGYVLRQVQGWAGRYEQAKTGDVPPLEETFSWLLNNVPEPQGVVLLHNDYKFDNVVFDVEDQGQIIGVLDWEMSTRGDPLMDVGTLLSYHVEANDGRALQAFRMLPTHLPGMMSRVEIANYYAKKSGRSVEDILFYYAFGLCKTAVVAQQIFARFQQGKTKDPRFAHLDKAVWALSSQAKKAVEAGRLDP